MNDDSDDKQEDKNGGDYEHLKYHLLETKNELFNTILERNNIYLSDLKRDLNEVRGHTMSVILKEIRSIEIENSQCAVCLQNNVAVKTYYMDCCTPSAGKDMVEEHSDILKKHFKDLIETDERTNGKQYT